MLMETLPADLLEAIFAFVAPRPVQRPEDLAPLARLRLVCCRFRDLIDAAGGPAALAREVRVSESALLFRKLLASPPRRLDTACIVGDDWPPGVEPEHSAADLLDMLPRPELLTRLRLESPTRAADLAAAARFQLRSFAVCLPSGELLGRDLTDQIAAVAARGSLEQLVLEGVRLSGAARGWAAAAGPASALALRSCFTARAPGIPDGAGMFEDFCERPLDISRMGALRIRSLDLSSDYGCLAGAGEGLAALAALPLLRALRLAGLHACEGRVTPSPPLPVPGAAFPSLRDLELGTLALSFVPWLAAALRAAAPGLESLSYAPAPEDELEEDEAGYAEALAAAGDAVAGAARLRSARVDLRGALGAALAAGAACSGAPRLELRGGEGGYGASRAASHGPFLSALASSGGLRALRLADARPPSCAPILGHLPPAIRHLELETAGADPAPLAPLLEAAAAAAPALSISVNGAPRLL
eukprot:tig00021312_g20044.t1